MRVPLSWLKDFVEITIPLDDLIHRMIMAGLEVANVEHIGDTWQRDKLFVGEVLEIKPHPHAERLVLAVVEYGQGTPQTVVTGAPNLRPGERGQKVAFAVEGAELLDGHSATPQKQILKRTTIRGVESAGMVCSEKELGLSDDHTGVIILDPTAPVGRPLQDVLGRYSARTWSSPRTWRMPTASSVWRAKWRRSPASSYAPGALTMPAWLRP